MWARFEAFLAFSHMSHSSIITRAFRFSLPAAVLVASSFISAQAADAPLVAGQPILVPDSKGGFDFLEFDAANNRLLADHPGNGTLDVIDGDTGKLIKHVATGAAQSVAIDAEAGKYFAGVSREKIVAVVDIKTLEKVGEYPIGGPADDMVLDPKNHFLYVDHDDGKDVWVIDSKTGKLVSTVSIEEGPECIVYDPVSDQVFQNIKPNNTLVVIDPATNKVKETWKVAPAQSPHGLALDEKTHRLFVAGGNGKLVVIDAGTGKVTADVDIAKGVDQIVFEPETKRIYCAAGAGTMTVLHETENGVESLGDVKTAAGAHTVTVNPKTHAVWVAYADRGTNKSYVLKLEMK